MGTEALSAERPNAVSLGGDLLAVGYNKGVGATIHLFGRAGIDAGDATPLAAWDTERDVRAIALDPGGGVLGVAHEDVSRGFPGKRAEGWVLTTSSLALAPFLNTHGRFDDDLESVGFGVSLALGTLVAFGARDDDTASEDIVVVWRIAGP